MNTLMPIPDSATLPESPQELAAFLGDAQAERRTINIIGRNTKLGMAGPVTAADMTVSTAKMTRVLKYEPRDLTISVEAGLPYGELSALLATHGQMLPLDPPFAHNASIGGIVAANTSGPRRRLYGTARDMVIGMTFATIGGKLVEAGGMVVKNVAGLDIGKLMIGSFGTLAAIAGINFRVHPLPAATRTFVRRFPVAAAAEAARGALMGSILQPMAVDVLKQDGEYRLLVQAGGSARVLDRYEQELPGFDSVEGVDEEALWRSIRELTPTFLAAHAGGAVVRVSCAPRETLAVLESLPSMAVARAGAGVCYGYFDEAEAALQWMRRPSPGAAVVEFSPDEVRSRAGIGEALWPEPGTAFETMRRVKGMFDPEGLLNRGRLFAKI